MLTNILLFLCGFLAGPAALLWLSKRIAKKAPAKTPATPSRSDLIACVEHLRDRMRVVQETSDQKVVVEIARRAHGRAESTLSGSAPDA